MVPGIYRVPRGTPVRGGGEEGGLDRGGGEGEVGEMLPMANTQTDEFIKTMTANRVQLAKAGHHKEVWFSERRRAEGGRRGRGPNGKEEGADWLGGGGWGGGVSFELIKGGESYADKDMC